MTNPLNNLNINILSTQKANIVQPGLQEENTQQFVGAQDRGMQSSFTKEITTPTMNYETAVMEQEVIVKYLKSLMSMPQTLEKLIAQLKTNRNITKNLKIILDNIIDVRNLNVLLKQNSSQAIQKLMQSIAEMAKIQSNTEQLKNILKIVTTIQNNITVNPDSIKELLLLYVPLNIQEMRENVYWGDFQDIIEQDNKNDASIMIETMNYSNILCLLNEIDNQIMVDIYANDTFPADKFNKVFYAVAKNTNMNASCEFKIIPDTKIRNEKQNFIAQTSGKISINALLLIQVLIKVIFRFDTEFPI